MTIDLVQREISVGDVERIAVDYTDWLDAGELLTGVVVAEVETAALTLDDEAISDAALWILSRTVAAGKAALFSCEAPTAGKYSILVTVTTNSTPPRTVNRNVRLWVR